jgi:uncharacterized repeat protein (TIGR03803 family)
VLHSFSQNGVDGFSPQAGLVFDAGGNLYGTTAFGGTYNYGTAFELTPQSGGVWNETILHSFNFDGTDGYNPYGGLVLDAAGNLYGTAIFGGTGSCNDDGPLDGCGIVFELTAKAGEWTEQILHNFTGAAGADGYRPYAGLVFDAKGNLYGTTLFGGTGPCVEVLGGPVVGCGTVFRLASGTGDETVLHSFGVAAKDGANPYSPIMLGATSGTLYGTTAGGGAYGGYGTVFELKSSGTKWLERVVHSFGLKNDGRGPMGELIFDKVGNMYGTTNVGGVYRSGTVFEISP